MASVGIAVQETDREGLDAVAGDQLGDRVPDAFQIEVQRHRAVVADALGHLAAKPPRHQRLGKAQAQIEQVVALFEAHIEDVAKTPRSPACR